MAKRHYIQALGALILNGNLKGFFEGRIYQGSLKGICVPALNCYSCPGALGSCPIGSLQGVAGGFGARISFYVLGLLGLFGIMAGRLFCGYLCPFGFFQELMYKLKSPKFKYSKAIKFLEKIKYLILFLIIFVPMMTTEVLDPLFCKYICPSGTLGAGVPLAIMDSGIRSAIGPLFFWKMGLAILMTFLSVMLWRPFCRVVCPLGAVFGLFNPISIYRLTIDDSCISCQKCQVTCHYDIYTKETPNSVECVRCDRCLEACPTGAINRNIYLDYGDYKPEDVV